MTPTSLDALRDIHLPPPPAVLPAVCLLVALSVIAVAGYVLWRRRRRSLHTALRELARLSAAYASDGDATALACGVSRLLRRYAVSRFPQACAAGLTGRAWLRFLDAHGGDGAFCDGVGTVLETRPYQRSGPVDAEALIVLTRRWLKANPQ